MSNQDPAKKRDALCAEYAQHNIGKESHKVRVRKRVFGKHSQQEVGARDLSTDVLILVVLVLDSNVKKELSLTSLLCLPSGQCGPGRLVQC